MDHGPVSFAEAQQGNTSYHELQPIRSAAQDCEEGGSTAENYGSEQAEALSHRESISVDASAMHE